MLSVFFTSLLSILLMKFTSEERLEDIISYFQIAFTLSDVGAFQLIENFVLLFVKIIGLRYLSGSKSVLAHFYF